MIEGADKPAHPFEKEFESLLHKTPANVQSFQDSIHEFEAKLEPSDFDRIADTFKNDEEPLPTPAFYRTLIDRVNARLKNNTDSTIATEDRIRLASDDLKRLTNERKHLLADKAALRLALRTLEDSED